MKRLLWLAVLLAGAPAPRAQQAEEEPPPSAEARPPETGEDAAERQPAAQAEPEPEEAPPPAKARPAEDAKPRGPMSLSDAKVNFATVVENFILEKSPKGYLPLKDASRRIWRLELETVHAKPMRKLKSNVFTSCASMRAGRDALDVDFTVDFGGEHWRVTQTHIHKVNGKPLFKYEGARRVRLP
ncbi:MAG: hypothetical protein HY554_01485 [Elusimicrobia bacterium]|nr:hypothetical protein [Elusimicrobiota bacterium]